MNPKLLACTAFVCMCTVLSSCQKDTEPGKIDVTSVQLDAVKFGLLTGETRTLSATVRPDDATNKEVKWVSDDETIATVSEEGVVTGIKAGETIITVETVDGGLTDECVVVVSDRVIPVTGIQLTPTNATISMIETLQLTATIIPAEATNQNIDWTSDNQTVATVDDNGLVTPVAAGTAVITAVTEDGEMENSCTVTVSLLGTVSFKSDKTWTVGDQIWSDVVVATGAKKDTYDGGAMGNNKPDFRQNEGYGDLFSWTAVNQYQNILCPIGWKVPAADDFKLLDRTLNTRGTSDTRTDQASYDNYLSPEKWGAQLAGRVLTGQGLNNTGTYAYYWARDERTATYGNAFTLQNTGRVDPNASADKALGFTVRCVKSTAGTFGTVSFATADTWEVGNQVWSDVVIATRCAKDTYDGGVYNGPYKVDCMQSAHGHLFSYEAVAQHGAELCTDGWRVPSSDDFKALDTALNGGTTYNRVNDPVSIENYMGAKWGGEYDGYAYANAVYNRGAQIMYAYFWSSTEKNAHTGSFLGTYNNMNTGACMTNPDADGGFKYLGFSVRCVKDK